MGRIVIFGGSGYLGAALLEKLYFYRNEGIVVVGRNESALVSIKERFPKIEIIVGDITDKWIVKKAMQYANEIYLLSALKHVNLAETEVRSCINTNIIGCMNVVEESLITRPEIFMFISTDKASHPMGVYRCTKKIGERLVAEAEGINRATKYRVVRYGNVLYSSGSVLCKWKDKMMKGQEVIVTDINATRFFWSVSDAIDLIFECLENAKDSTPYVPKMKSIRLGDLLGAMMSKYGYVPVKTIGLQHGENMHEIISENGMNSFDSPRFTNEEILQLI